MSVCLFVHERSFFRETDKENKRAMKASLTWAKGMMTFFTKETETIQICLLFLSTLLLRVQSTLRYTELSSALNFLFDLLRYIQLVIPLPLRSVYSSFHPSHISPCIPTLSIQFFEKLTQICMHSLYNKSHFTPTNLSKYS